tara:strand:+ start:1398 stop:2957 length:1560 start_codon:yes stop_codon:yes gene_type:complete
MENKKENNLTEKKEISNDEIDFKLIINLLIRNKYLLTLVTVLTTFGSIFLSKITEPTYRGSFQIVVGKKNNSSNGLSNSQKSLLTLTGITDDKDSKTEEFILRSPSVLKPVYRYALSQYKNRGEEVEDLNYKRWVENTLEIKFEVGTNILNIDFIDKDKLLILKILDLVSKKYQDYSKLDKEKELAKEKIYLENQQKKYKTESKRSLKKLNSFALENGLGNLDGLPILSKDSNEFNVENNNIRGITRTNPNQRGNEVMQRFGNQLMLLEKYESEYLNLSSVIKPNSKYLNELQNRIDNLRSSLKRPNEILIEYRELTKKARRDEAFLNNIEVSLGMINLEIAKQQNPWALISEPTIADKKAYPKTERNAFFSFVFSLFLGYLFASLKEKKSGIIYEFNELKERILCDYLETIFLKNSALSSKIITNIFNKNLNTESIGVLNLCKIEDSIINANFFKKINKKIIYTENIDFEEIKNCKDIFIITTTGSIKKNKVLLLNKYLNIHQEKIVGWFYLDKKTLL